MPGESFKLYSYYTKVVTNFYTETVQEVNDWAGEEFLAKMADLWEKHRIPSFWMQWVFQDLDRCLTNNLFSTAPRSFQDSIYTKLKDRCVKALINVINRERNGEGVNQDVIRTLVKMFCTVRDLALKLMKQRGQTREQLGWQSPSKGLYKVDFETPSLEATAEFYKAKVVGWLAARFCPDFVEQVNRRLVDEKR